jgi:hypothetical protein
MADLYTSIHKLPFHIFQDIILEENLSLLGDGTDMERMAAWEDILSQYAEAIGDGDTDGYLSDRRELLFFETQRYLVDTHINFLKYWVGQGLFVKKWAKQLSHMVRMEITFTDKEDLLKQLDMAYTRSRGIIDLHIIGLRDKVEKYRNEKEADASDLKPTREFFAKVLLNLHEFSNWQFDDNTISTFQYCELTLRYNQHLNYQKSKRQKQWQD